MDQRTALLAHLASVLDEEQVGRAELVSEADLFALNNYLAPRADLPLRAFTPRVNIESPRRWTPRDEPEMTMTSATDLGTIAFHAGHARPAVCFNDGVLIPAARFTAAYAAADAMVRAANEGPYSAGFYLRGAVERAHAYACVTPSATAEAALAALGV